MWPLFQCESEQYVAGRNFWQKCLSLCIRTAQLDRCRSQKYGGEERCGCDRASRLLQDETKTYRTELRSAIRFGHENAGEAQIRHFLPGSPIKAIFVFFVAQFTQVGDGQFFLEKLRCCFFQEHLLFSEY